ncbi:Uncharacterized protein FWK35_00016076 [Aphis craccivora]|uniref:Uncharacterized protein n=1 Tax=Aphis craccivora TaxID=307492 RepID=A0A6G0ZAA9_APHCR|nr:Uncharacterized protein FWK35_00016076 [Aphis craccivora]
MVYVVLEPPQPFNSLLTRHCGAQFGNLYNTLFQMTSFGSKEIHEGNFMLTFKIEGQIYHLIGSLLPKTGQSSTFYRYISLLMRINFLCDQTWAFL